MEWNVAPVRRPNTFNKSVSIRWAPARNFLPEAEQRSTPGRHFAAVVVSGGVVSSLHAAGPELLPLLVLSWSQDDIIFGCCWTVEAFDTHRLDLGCVGFENVVSPTIVQTRSRV